MRQMLTFCSSLLLLAACTAAGSITPNPSASPSAATPSASPSASSGASASGSFAVTANSQAYSEFLGCMGAKHPDGVFLILQSTVKSGVYDSNWASYRAQADVQVQNAIKAYGHECGT